MYIFNTKENSIKLEASALKLKGQKLAFFTFQAGSRTCESDKIVFLAEAVNQETLETKMQLVTYKRGEQEAHSLFEDSPARKYKDYELSECTIF